MALSYRLINSPSASTRRLLTRRMPAERGGAEEEALFMKKSASWGAVLLVQGPLAEMFWAADVGAKTSPVVVAEVVGNCPQHIVTMAFIGAVADVTQVLTALRSEGAIA
ncbi:MAG: microcompartment protein [Synergistaceae bacterium]|jgi:hypothetical protein|nr:microcompartment protein [Synergistaceae bacterium]